jgi:AcrR family transcriptional regulator
MARARSPEKRAAILEAAVREIAENGLGAATAKIAQSAGVAEGTLFTYFANKEELLNELYLELKGEVYVRVNTGFPQKSSLERRAHHVWWTYLDWAIEFPMKRKASVLLNVSDVITAETRTRSAIGRELIDAALAELEGRGSLKGLPAGFAAAAMSAMQEAAMDFIARYPKQRKELTERGFALLWRAVK